MRYFDKTFFKFLFVFFLLISLSLAVIKYASAQVISEVMYDLSGTDTDREWIEVYNSGASDIDLSTWKIFEANTNHSINVVSGSATLPAGSYAIIADNTAKFLLDWPSFSGPLFDSSFSLSNSGETLILKDSSLTAIDTLTYDPNIGAAGDGNSLQLSGPSWLSAAPTPGATNASAGSTSSTTATSTDNGAASSSTSSSSSGANASAHYSSANLSNKKPGTTTTLSAGRDRLSAPGTPLQFVAETNLTSVTSSEFEWNFGDGTTDRGATVVHSYEFPGEYVVILSAVMSDGQVIARANVKVVEDKLAILSADTEKIQIKNNSSYEINLYGRALVVGERSFAFPKDTIIKAGQALTLSSVITLLKPANTSEVAMLVIGYVEEAKVKQKIAEEKNKMILSLEKRLWQLESSLASQQFVYASPSPVVVPAPAATTSEVLKSEAQTAIATEAVERSSWWQTFKKFLMGR